LTDVTVATPRASFLDEPPPGCGAGAMTTYEVVADVARSPGPETVTATLTGGLAVYDVEHHLIATAPGYECEGSADEIVALATGSAFGEPTIALAVRQGGHRHDDVTLALFRIGATPRLEPAFTVAIEERDDDDVQRGGVWVLPDGLLYRGPGTRPLTLWHFDPVGRLYTFRGRLDQLGNQTPSLH
jgi:hypothetical protein